MKIPHRPKDYYIHVPPYIWYTFMCAPNRKEVSLCWKTSCGVISSRPPEICARILHLSDPAFLLSRCSCNFTVEVETFPGYSVTKTQSLLLLFVLMCWGTSTRTLIWPCLTSVPGRGFSLPKNKRSKEMSNRWLRVSTHVKYTCRWKLICEWEDALH